LGPGSLAVEGRGSFGTSSSEAGSEAKAAVAITHFHLLFLKLLLKLVEVSLMDGFQSPSFEIEGASRQDLAESN